MAIPSDIANPQRIADTISSLLTSRDGIRSTLHDSWEINEAAGETLMGLKNIIQNIGVNDNIDVDLMEGDTYSIPKGYHTGRGVVKGVAGGGNYTLQAKTVSAGRSDITVVPDQGKYGLSSVKVNAISSNLQDVSYVTATASDVLVGKNIVISNGTVTAGTMVNNGTVTQTLSTAATAYTIPQGYHSGSGKVSIKLEEKTTTPSTSVQVLVPTAGSVLSKVTVNAIPAPYYDVSGVTATAAQVLTGSNFVTSAGVLTAGTMANRGAVSQTLSTTSTQYTITQGYHNGSGTVKIVTEDKTFTPTKSVQTTYATAGKVVNKVTVNAIPAAYQDVTGVTAVASHVLSGEQYVDSSGTTVTGTMPNIGHKNYSAWNYKGNVIIYRGYNDVSGVIQEGYHDGTGIVAVDASSSVVVPTKSTQIIKGPSHQLSVQATANELLTQVTVEAIPSAYQDVTGVTATASQVLTGSSYVTSDGTLTAGTMTNNGAVSQTLSTTSTQYTVPQGYHNGSGKVSIVTETKSATPSTSAQTVVATSGKVLSSVSVAAIPNQYKDTSSADAVASNVLSGKKFVNGTGTVTGTMPNNGSTNASIYFSVAEGANGYTKAFTIPSGYHDGTGVVQAQYAIKTVTPTTSQQTIRADDHGTGQVPFLSSVIVNAIPSPYYDVSGVTATAGQVLTGSSFVTSTGVLTAGTMANRGAVSQTLSTTSTQYTVTQGYHNGSGKVSITLEDKTLTPSAAAQTVYATSGKVINKVTVNAIPAPYYNTSGVTAVASHVLNGEKFVDSSGSTIIGTMPNRAASLTTLDTATTQYTISNGYHDGTGKVIIKLAEQTVTPSATGQVIQPASGFVLSKVTVNPIPAPYYDVSGVTAAASQVLAGTSYVTSAGVLTAGTMTNRGAVSQTLSTTSTQYTVPQGYHNGAGVVKIVTETKSATPSTAAQTVVATSGKVLSSVSVAAIPNQYKDTTGADAVAANVLSGKKFVNTTGTVTGSMTNNGSYVSGIDGLTIASKLIPQGYHDGTGYIYLTNAIEIALASI